MDDEVGGDVVEKVIAMHLNRPKTGFADRLNPLPSPGEIGDGERPHGRGPHRGHGQEPQPESAPPPPEPESSSEAERQPPQKKSDPLPRPGDAYRAQARFLNQLSSDPRLIHFVDKDCWSVGFAYSDLRRVEWRKPVVEGGGPVLVLRFMESVITDVAVEGRNLEEIHHWVSEGRMPWLWEQPAGFKTRDDHAVVITRFSLHTVDRETGQWTDGER
jgi:hypothetical protein